jgi:hypothetical protein
METLKQTELHAATFNTLSTNNWYMVFDIETKKYPTRPKFDVPDEWVAGGWHDYMGMGIACVGFVLVSLDYGDVTKSKKMPCGVTGDLEEVARVLDVVKAYGWALSGFNTKSFDANLLKAHGFDLHGLHHYDVFDQVTKALNIASDNRSAMRGLGLDAIAKANNCPAKSGKGVDAPKMYQLGQIEKLHAYCLDDCDVEASLLIEVHKTGGIVNPKNNSYLRLVTP